MRQRMVWWAETLAGRRKNATVGADGENGEDYPMPAGRRRSFGGRGIPRRWFSEEVTSAGWRPASLFRGLPAPVPEVFERCFVRLFLYSIHIVFI